MAAAVVVFAFALLVLLPHCSWNEVRVVLVETGPELVVLKSLLPPSAPPPHHRKDAKHDTRRPSWSEF